LNEQVSGFTNDNLAELMICYKIEEIAEDYLTRNIQKTYRSVETIASLKLRLGLHIVMGNFFKK
jgi:accessory gene regulator protein AgrB